MTPRKHDAVGYSSIADSWVERQQRLGNTPRAVLFKNLPNTLNANIHKQHTEFVLSALTPDTLTLLDVGCGYGRIADEVASIRPDIKIFGVEPCEPFAEQFRSKYAGCAPDTIQNFHTDDSYDVIIIVTTLMYVSPQEHMNVATKLWKSLAPNGRLVCIEPCSNWIINARQHIPIDALKPTGKHVHYFSRKELTEIWTSQPASKLLHAKGAGILPYANCPRIHEMLIIEKIRGVTG